MGDKSQWASKLMGKKLSETESNEIVSDRPLWNFSWQYLTHILAQSFAKKDLPKSHRVLKPGDMKTMDEQPDRYGIYTRSERCSKL